MRGFSATRNTVSVNGKPVRAVQSFRAGPLHVSRFQRSALLWTEAHNHGDVKYVNLTVGHPTRHARWAFSAYLDLPGWLPLPGGSRMRRWL